MKDIQIYIILSSILTGTMALVWSTREWKDIFFKVALFASTIAGIAIYLKHYYL